MRHRQVAALPELAAARVEAIDDRPFPVQVDGDYIGEYSEVEFGVTPGGLLAVVVRLCPLSRSASRGTRRTPTRYSGSA